MRLSLRCVLLFVLLGSTTTLAATDPRVKDAERLAAHGEVAAARSQLQLLHDELTTSGADTSAALHYNLGTLALSEDDVGDAVLHLMAATRRAPLDDDIRHNLGEALARRADQVSSSGAQAPGARLPRGPVQVAFGLALALLGGVLAAAGLSSSSAGAAARRAVAPVVISVVVSGALYGVRRHADSIDVAVIMKDTDARSQPEAGAKGFAVHPGLSGVVVAEQQGFLRLRLENGVDVWVDRDDVRLVP